MIHAENEHFHQIRHWLFYTEKKIASSKSESSTRTLRCGASNALACAEFSVPRDFASCVKAFGCVTQWQEN